MGILTFLSGVLDGLFSSASLEPAAEPAERNGQRASEGALERPPLETLEQKIERLATEALHSDWQHRKVQALEQIQALLPHDRCVAYAFRLAENLQSTACANAVFDTTLTGILSSIAGVRELAIKPLAFSSFDALLERREAFLRQYREEERLAMKERLETIERDILKGAKFVVYEMTADVPPKIKALTERAIQQMEEKYLQSGELSPYAVKVLFAECDQELAEISGLGALPVNLSEA